jgi:hypothetical protein
VATRRVNWTQSKEKGFVSLSLSLSLSLSFSLLPSTLVVSGEEGSGVLGGSLVLDKYLCGPCHYYS